MAHQLNRLSFRLRPRLITTGLLISHRRMPIQMKVDDEREMVGGVARQPRVDDAGMADLNRAADERLSSEASGQYAGERESGTGRCGRQRIECERVRPAGSGWLNRRNARPAFTHCMP
jgi:hypothetical protein